MTIFFCLHTQLIVLFLFSGSPGGGDHLHVPGAEGEGAQPGGDRQKRLQRESFQVIQYVGYKITFFSLSLSPPRCLIFFQTTTRKTIHMPTHFLAGTHLGK